jgi:hypothetical protein
MILSGTSYSELPLSSTTQMYLTHNGEVFHITLSIQLTPVITLNLDK